MQQRCHTCILYFSAIIYALTASWARFVCPSFKVEGAFAEYRRSVGGAFPVPPIFHPHGLMHVLISRSLAHSLLCAPLTSG